MIYRKWGKSILIIWLINICFVVGLFAQNKIEQKITSIVFEGIEKNKERYLNQFLESKNSNYLSDSLLLKDVQRLKNIPGIGNATYRLDTVDQSISVVFQIEEIKTLLPIVNFGGIKDNVWFQLGFYDANWQGSGGFLSAIYQNQDNRHGGQIYYRAPRIKGSDWGISASLNMRASSEPLFFQEGILNYDYTNYEAGLTIIKQFGFRNQLEFGGTYFIEKYEKSKSQVLEIPTSPGYLVQPKFLSKIEYTSDYLDYHYFYLKGFYWKAGLQNVYNIQDQSWFHSLEFSGKYFSRIGKKGNLGIRFQMGIATNNNSPFTPFVIDSHVNLRGVGNRIARSTAKFMINSEYRYTWLESKKWAVQAVGFLDIGTWRSPGSSLEELFDVAQVKQFAGGGLRLIYRKIYGTVLRIDYGVNVQNVKHHGIVIGFGQYF